MIRIGTSVISKAVCAAFNQSEELLKASSREVGLASATAALFAKSTFKEDATGNELRELTVLDVVQVFRLIIADAGKNVTDRRVELVAGLLRRCKGTVRQGWR